MKSAIPADVSARPHTCTLEHQLKSPPARVYQAWTERFDWWFAEPGQLLMWPEVDRPWFFLNRKDWSSHPHHGRFLELEQDRLVVTTWVTGKGGTDGAETIVRLELTPKDGGTLVKLTHTGLQSEASAQGHKDNWPLGLDEIDKAR